MTERQFYVWRTLKGTQLTIVTARSKADAVRRVIEGQGEQVSFEITDAARTGMALPVGDLDS